MRHWIKKSEYGGAYSPVRSTAKKVESSVPARWTFCDWGSTGGSRVHSPQVGPPWQDHRQVPCVQWSVARGKGKRKGEGKATGSRLAFEGAGEPYDGVRTSFWELGSCLSALSRVWCDWICFLQVSRDALRTEGRSTCESEGDRLWHC